MLRNRWPDQIGMGGRMLSESVAGYVRIAHAPTYQYRNRIVDYVLADQK